jgi:hypothetical protein
MMNPTDEHLQTFFAHYGEALSAGDLKAISDCYALPSLVLSDAGSVPITTRAEIEAAFDGAAERYRAQGLVAVRPTLVASKALTERLVSVDLRWDYLDGQGSSVQTNAYRYLVRLVEGTGPGIQVVIAASER